MPLNLAAWALASAWRRTALPYGLYGPAVLTGAHLAGGGVAALPAVLAAQVQDAADAVRNICAAWRSAPPESEQAARQALCAAAAAACTAAHEHP